MKLQPYIKSKIETELTLIFDVLSECVTIGAKGEASKP